MSIGDTTRLMKVEMSRNKCRDCGATAKKSKAIVNYHHIRRSYLRGQVEFQTLVEPCLKCPECGHSWRNNSVK